MVTHNFVFAAHLCCMEMYEKVKITESLDRKYETTTDTVLEADTSQDEVMDEEASCYVTTYEPGRHVIIIPAC